MLLKVLLILTISASTYASHGDKSTYFVNCFEKCKLLNCKQNELLYKKDVSFSDHLAEMLKYRKYDWKVVLEDVVRWNCRDECKYSCMWKTTEAFVARKWKPVQFFGKWPFIRFLGMQEPASVIFSALNFLVHYKMFQEFRRSVRITAPLYKMWHSFSLICLNAWFWSMVFHTRDFPITELFDYVFAYSMVLASFYCMIIRMVHTRSKIFVGFITTMSLLFFINHFAYLSMETFDYTYNMHVNILTGVLGGVGWVVWCLTQIRKRPYVWKCLVFVLLAGAAMALEVNDFPPIFWTFDSHALWHLATAPITILFYKFIIDDCHALHKEMLEKNKPKPEEHEKERDWKKYR